MQYIGNHVINETAPKVHCFDGFCHHHLVTTSAHMHVYHYPLFESRMKTGCETLLYVEKIQYCYMNTKNNSKAHYS